MPPDLEQCLARGLWVFSVNWSPINFELQPLVLSGRGRGPWPSGFLQVASNVCSRHGREVQEEKQSLCCVWLPAEKRVLLKDKLGLFFPSALAAQGCRLRKLCPSL